MFWRKKETRWLWFTWSIGTVLLVLVLLLFGFLFSRVLTAKDTIQGQLVDEGTNSLNRLLTVLYPLDTEWTKAFASLLSLVTEQWSTVVDELTLLKNMLLPFQEKSWSLFSFLQHYFPEHADIIHSFSLLEKDVSSLLGMEKEQTYLVVLQNTAEKRPNWWFFGSFALVTLSKWKIVDFTVSDSYHPGYNRPTTKILWPDWLEKFLPERDIYFIGANKVWFTYHDGPQITTLYEKSYPWKKIRGVIFLRTDMFSDLLPGFEEQLRRRQYINATVDLIRGEERRWKKDIYLASLEEYLAEHRGELLEAFWMKLPTLLQERKINLYLESVSGKMHTLLREYDLTTRFEDDHAYFRDSNIIFNKLDMFVEKKIRLTNSNNELLGSRSDDIVELPLLRSGHIYTFAIQYTLAVPESYHVLIRSLNETYGIELWQREEHILWVHHEWATRGNIYFPPYFSIIAITWDIASQRTFDTPFSHNAAYETHIWNNNSTNTIYVQVKVQ